MLDEPTVRRAVTLVSRYMLLGAGDPEGNVDAPFGAEFIRQDGAPGSSRYVKESSEGTLTGWRAL